MSIHRRSVSLALVGLFVCATGCATYASTGPKYVPITPQEVSDYGRVRVTTVVGQTVTMEDPRVEEGSIKSPNVGAIPLSQVTEIEGASLTRRGYDLSTVMAVVGVGAVATEAYFTAAPHW